jgi:hypothetical protein
VSRVLLAVWGTAAALVLATLAACDSGERREAETVILAIGRLRTADNPSIPGAVEALRKTPCRSPDVCRARDSCLAAGDATSSALRLKGEVEKSLGRLEKGALAKESAEAQALPGKLDEAERFLKEGHDGLAGCDEQTQALKRKHRI